MNIPTDIKLLVDSWLDINPDDYELPTPPDAIRVPVSVGQIVYTQRGTYKLELDVQPFQVTNIAISQNKKGIWTKKFGAYWAPNGKTTDYGYTFAFDDLGKAVFCSKKAAEMVWNRIINSKRETNYD